MKNLQELKKFLEKKTDEEISKIISVVLFLFIVELRRDSTRGITERDLFVSLDSIHNLPLVREKIKNERDFAIVEVSRAIYIFVSRGNNSTKKDKIKNIFEYVPDSVLEELMK